MCTCLCIEYTHRAICKKGINDKIWIFIFDEIRKKKHDGKIFKLGIANK